MKKKEVKEKKFKSLIPRKLLKEAEEEWKNNAPQIECIDPKVQVIMQVFVNKWWKKGGWKIVLDEFLKEFTN